MAVTPQNTKCDHNLGWLCASSTEILRWMALGDTASGTGILPWMAVGIPASSAGILAWMTLGDTTSSAGILGGWLWVILHQVQ